MQNKNVGELLNFIEASKAKGASDEFLASFLMRRDWPQDDVYAALGAYWERATGLAIPDRTAGGESSRDAFLYLLSFSTLATWSSALGSMLFRFIDRWVSRPGRPRSCLQPANRSHLANGECCRRVSHLCACHANHFAGSPGSSGAAAIRFANG